MDKKQRIKKEKETREEREGSIKEMGHKNEKLYLASSRREGFSDSIEEGSRGEVEQVEASKKSMENKTKEMNQCKWAQFETEEAKRKSEEQQLIGKNRGRKKH